MSEFYPTLPTVQESEKEKALAKALSELTVYFKEITEFSTKELKAISLLQTDQFLAKLLEFYVINKKHVKRKYSKEILKAFEMCSREPKIDKSLVDSFFHRNRY